VAGGISIQMKVEGLGKILSRLNDPRVRPVAQKHMDNGMKVIEGGARFGSPVDTGNLRKHWESGVEEIGGDLSGYVGNRVTCAPPMEFGTGLLYDGPGGGSGKAHFPPPSALERWAYLHGLNAYAVALSIFRRGGLKPRRMLRNSADQNWPRVTTILSRILTDVTSRLVGK